MNAIPCGLESVNRVEGPEKLSLKRKSRWRLSLSHFRVLKSSFFLGLGLGNSSSKCSVLTFLLSSLLPLGRDVDDFVAPKEFLRLIITTLL